MRWPAIALVPFLCASAAHAASFGGKVVGVADGDTITVLRDRRPVKIRLHGVDCPEKDQPFGQKAKQLTSQLVFGKLVDVTVVTTDRYGRTVGRVRFASNLHRTPLDRDKPHQVVTTYRSLQRALVEAGLAWWYRRYAADDKELAALEQQARAAKRGLWADVHAVAPWDWRRGKRTATAAEEPPAPKRNCFQTCMRQRSAQAVGIQVIEAECTRQCSAEGAGRPVTFSRPGSAAAGPVEAAGLQGNVRSKVLHAAGCRDLARCTHCTRRFASIDDALRTGFRPHQQCVRGAPSGAARASSAPSPLAGQVGRRVRLVGRAAEAKAGPVVLPDGAGEPVYVKGLDGWRELVGKQVLVTGVLRRVKLIPDPVQDPRGAISQGAHGEQYVVEDARWQRQ